MNNSVTRVRCSASATDPVKPFSKALPPYRDWPLRNETSGLVARLEMNVSCERSKTINAARRAFKRRTSRSSTVEESESASPINFTTTQLGSRLSSIVNPCAVLLFIIVVREAVAACRRATSITSQDRTTRFQSSVDWWAILFSITG